MIKVLIVEDDPMVAKINEKFLQRVEGFSLTGSANTLEKAKEEIRNRHPDLILLDVFFPKGKGIDLLKWIRSENYRCDVILITADRTSVTIEEAFRFGVMDYLVKPFVFERFKEALVNYKQRKNNLQNEMLEQDEIDRYIVLEKKNVKEESMDVEGYLNDYTYKKIIEVIHSMKSETFTSEKIAQKVGVSRITARRYLDYLERKKVLELQPEYGKVGRPTNKYKLIE